MTKIDFVQSGGFMGRTIILSLDLDDMPPHQAQTFNLLLDQADFFHLEVDPAKPPVPDSFTYTITVTTDERSHTIHVSDTTAPEQLRPLLLALSARARIR